MNVCGGRVNACVNFSTVIGYVGGDGIVIGHRSGGAIKRSLRFRWLSFDHAENFLLKLFNGLTILNLELRWLNIIS